MRKIKWILICTSIFLITLIFLSPGFISAMSYTEEVAPYFDISQSVSTPENIQPTPTPFQPLPPTPTYLPTIEVQSISAKPTKTPDEPPKETEPPLTFALEDRLNLLLLGSDQRPYEWGFRTDTIILVSLDPIKGTASLVSFPRDLYLTIPGWTEQRINTAMGYGGFPLLAATLEYNFGVRPTHYVMVNFFAFKQTIDSLGGIDVYAAETISDHRDKHGYYTIPAGLNHMDGETALWYSRARYSTSDFDRTRRQQEVILALFERILSLDGIEKAPDLYEIYAENVTTNLGWQDIAPLLPLAAKLSDTSNIRHYYVGPGQVTAWTTPGGAQVLLPNYNAINGLLWQAIYGE